MPDSLRIDRFMRLTEVREACGLGSSTIYRHIAAGTFPKPVKLSETAVAWYESEIAAWQQSRPRTNAVAPPKGSLPD
jgi:prophage regulatory protein